MTGFKLTDETGNGYDLNIITSSELTFSSGGMPNSDNYVTGPTSSRTVWVPATGLDINNGSAWTIEFWFYLTSVLGADIELMRCEVTSSFLVWQLQIDANERVVLTGYQNDGSTVYTQRKTAQLSASQWYHVVCLYQTGSTPTIYIDTATSSNASTAPTGTAGTIADGSLMFWSAPSNVRLAKFAMWERSLSTSEILDHYLAMTAA